MEEKELYQITIGEKKYYILQKDYEEAIINKRNCIIEYDESIFLCTETQHTELLNFLNKTNSDTIIENNKDFIQHYLTGNVEVYNSINFKK